MLHSTALRRVLLIGLLILVSTGQADIAFAETSVWTSHGPEGGVIYALAVDPVTPATLYAGTAYGGVFKSTNGGGNWAARNSGLTNSIVLALAVDPVTPSTVYAGTQGGGVVNQGGGVFKSTNAGASWAEISTGLTDTNVLALAVDPLTPTTLYAGTNGGGVFKSINGGADWSPVNSGLTNTSVRVLAVDPQSPAIVYAGTDGGVFKSTNGGENWSPVNTGLTNTNMHALAVDPVTPATVYAGTQGGGVVNQGGSVFKSTNGGGSWAEINTGLTDTNILALAIDPSTPATVYAGTYGGGVFKSANGGESWSAANTGLLATDVYALAVNPATPSTVYAGTGDSGDYSGVFRSTNAGGSWAAINTGLANTGVSALAIDPVTPLTVYAGTASSGLFKSTNGGGSWTAINTGLTYPYTYIDAVAVDTGTPSTVYAGTQGGGVFKSVNGGGNWTAINAGLWSWDVVLALVLDPQTPATIYAGSNGGVFKSTNGGASWVITGMYGTYIYALVGDPMTPATIYAGGEGGVFKTTNGGGDWSPVSTGLTDTNVRALAVDPTTPATVYAGTSEGGVFKTTNGGENWAAINTGLTSTYVQALAVDPATLYAGTNGGGVVFKSTNGGESWAPFNTGLGVAGAAALAVDPVTPAIVYAGTSSGGVFSTRQYQSTTLAITGHMPEPSDVGQPVEVSFALSVEPPAGGTPTGVVTVTDGSASCTASLPAGSCSLTLSTAGTHTLVASYAGDGGFLPSVSPGVAHIVQSGTTTLAITAHTPQPSYPGQSLQVVVSLSVLPPASGTPTGLVTVTDGTASCAATLPASSCGLTLMSAGTHTLVASYSGDTEFLPSVSSRVDHLVHNPVATLLSLDPPSALVHSSACTLIVHGADFVPGSVVRWNGADRSTTFVSSTQLQAAIGEADLASAGDASVTVFNPSPGGGLSAPLAFTIADREVYLPLLRR